MKLGLVAVVFVAARSAWGYFGLELVMLPDFALYSSGGLGLFPSPLGRLLGSLGPAPFAVVSVVGAGVCTLAVGLAARARGASMAWACWLFALSPASLYLAYAGVDAPALALLLLAFGSRHTLGRAAGVTLAALTHLSLVPFALLLGRRGYAGWLAGSVLGLVALGSVLLTPYSGVVFGILEPGALTAMGLGALVGLGLSLPALLFVGRPPLAWWFALAVGVLECGAQHHLQARYLLPAAAIAAASARWPAWSTGSVLSRSAGRRVALLSGAAGKLP